MDAVGFDPCPRLLDEVGVGLVVVVVDFALANKSPISSSSSNKEDFFVGTVEEEEDVVVVVVVVALAPAARPALGAGFKVAVAVACGEWMCGEWCVDVW